MKKYFILFLVFLTHSAIGQVENIIGVATDTVSLPIATKKGNGLVSGLISFSSLSGELNTGFRDDPVSTVTFSPSYLYFISDRLGFGAAMSFARISQRDISVSSWGFGPQVSYYFDNGHTAIPYLGGSVNYILIDDSRRKANGLGVNLGGGILFRKGHMGFAIQGGYQYENVKKEDTAGRISGGTTYLRFGFLGFIY